MRRGPLALVVVLVLLGACNSDSEPETARTPVTTVAKADATTTSLLTCDGIGAPPPTAEITYFRGGRVEAVAPDGTGRRCLLADVPAPRQAGPAWGGAADRLLVPPTDVFLADGRHSADVGPQATSSWSRPTGTSVLALGKDRHLRKHPATGGPFTEISFQRRTDEAVYHPAGRHIAAVGIDNDGRYGITLATNRGDNPRPLALGETAERIHTLAFRHSGDVLWFLADHGDRTDLHVLDLAGGRLDTIPTIGRPSHVVLSAFDFRLSAFQADCTTYVVHEGVQRQPLTRLRPLAFLGDGRLIALSGCDGAGDVRVVGTDNAVGPPIARGVEHVAVRQALPPPGELPNTTPNAAPA